MSIFLDIQKMYIQLPRQNLTSLNFERHFLWNVLDLRFFKMKRGIFGNKLFLKFPVLRVNILGPVVQWIE